ncbi:cation channel sperm-associated protein 3-like, partial [Ornithorhynchus anatinus]|uniref:cation channel sperm-associated protein 3-like n=1 Tax=Ornithorhynchus anatinus TaxID=9258 RepID=UPI0019D430EA
GGERDGLAVFREETWRKHQQGVRASRDEHDAETLLKALWRTVNMVASVLALLFLLMFIFAILDHSLFGNQDKGDTQNWGNLASAFFKLFSLATVDGWTFLQNELNVCKFSISGAFTITFILLAFFLFLSMFFGMMIIHTRT